MPSFYQRPIPQKKVGDAFMTIKAHGGYSGVKTAIEIAIKHGLKIKVYPPHLTQRLIEYFNINPEMVIK